MGNQGYNQRDCLLQKIEHAFAGVTLGEGISIHQTEVLDDYGSDDELIKARRLDIQHDWRLLLKDERFKQIHGVGGPLFLDAKGLRYYLPAYLTLMVMDHKHCPNACETLLGILTHTPPQHTPRPFEHLTQRQKRCVRDCLKWVLHNTGSWCDFDQFPLRRALKQYWIPICRRS